MASLISRQLWAGCADPHTRHPRVHRTDESGAVCEWYFNRWFPAALTTIREARASGVADNEFVVQTHPWILQELLYGSAGCTNARPSADTVAGVRAEMQRGAFDPT
jgi:hypothetical protein